MMKYLKEYIKEGLFDDLDKIEKIGGMESNVEMLKKEVIDWIIKNTKGQIHENKFKLDFNTTPITVDYSGSIEFKTNITSLTNGNFQWGKVSGDFRCFECESLESFEGAPKEVGWDFNCFKCKSLKSLEGSPKKVGGYFNCDDCYKLTSLKGAPKEVRDYFSCEYCPELTSLKGAPEKVGGSFYCSRCKSLKSLEGCPKAVGGFFSCSECSSLKSLKGAPKEVGSEFYCKNCGIQFTEEDVIQICKVKRKIYC